MTGKGGRARPGRWWKVAAAGACAAWIAWCLGQVLRDRSWLSGMCFHVPSPVVAAALLVLGVSALTRSRRLALACLALSAPPVFFVVRIENRWTRDPVPAASPAYHIVHWNVMSGHLGWSAIEERLAGLGADACVLSEAPAGSGVEDLARRLGPGYSAVRFGDMAVVARGSLRANGWLASSDLRVQSLEWTPDGVPLEVLAVDIESDPLIARDPLLRTLLEICAARGPDIVIGDFNAPRRSSALSPLPGGLRHAYEAAGSGWSYTWPVPLPIYAIDHCIVGKRIRPASYDLITTFQSDHRLQVLGFDIVQGPSPRGA